MSLLPRERTAAITCERFRFERTSAIFQDHTRTPGNSPEANRRRLASQDSRENVLDGFAGDAGQANVETLEFYRQFGVLDA